MARETYYAYPPLLMSADEAARYINVAPRTLSELQAKGEITPVDGIGKRSFRREDLERWAAHQPEWQTPTTNLHHP